MLCVSPCNLDLPQICSVAHRHSKIRANNVPFGKVRHPYTLLQSKFLWSGVCVARIFLGISLATWRDRSAYIGLCGGRLLAINRCTSATMERGGNNLACGSCYCVLVARVRYLRMRTPQFLIRRRLLIRECLPTMRRWLPLRWRSCTAPVLHRGRNARILGKCAFCRFAKYFPMFEFPSLAPIRCISSSLLQVYHLDLRAHVPENRLHPSVAISLGSFRTLLSASPVTVHRLCWRHAIDPLSSLSSIILRLLNHCVHFVT